MCVYKYTTYKVFKTPKTTCVLSKQNQQALNMYIYINIHLSTYKFSNFEMMNMISKVSYQVMLTPSMQSPPKDL